ncbi:MAG: hypothetical protein U0414_42200 [Polyangiaceae bacterium]
MGFGEAPPDDAAGDALALARLVIGCGASSARKGSARGRGWDRVAQFEPGLGRFIRQSLGEYGQTADRRAAHEALVAWRRAIAAGESAPMSRRPVPVAITLSSTLVARFDWPGAARRFALPTSARARRARRCSSSRAGAA